jgi:DNA-3-methyladenine glycosylase
MAGRLIGATLLVDGVGGTIVETEAYTRDDPASHSFRGQTKANAAMFGPAWQAYVYRSYGLHWCFNIVATGQGAVLIRAIAPEYGVEQMIARRGSSSRLCSGPGRLAQALGITSVHNGLSLSQPPFEVNERSHPPEVVCGRRIGISKAIDQPWRFGLAGSPYLSQPFRLNQ